MVEEDVEHLSHAATINVQGGVGMVIYDSLEHVVPDQIWTAVYSKTNDKHVDKYFEDGKAAEELSKRLLRKDKSLAVIASLV